MSFELHTNQQQVPSFEVSRWFASVLDRIDNLQNLNYLQSNWIRITLRLRNTQRLRLFRHSARLLKEEKSSRSTKYYWFLLYSKLLHTRKRKIFNTAVSQLRDARQRADDLKRAKRSLNMPSTDSGTMYSETQNESSSCNDELDDSPRAKKWRSMAFRFLRQTLYIELQRAYDDYQKELKDLKRTRQETWQFLAFSLIWDDTRFELKQASKKLRNHRAHWRDLVSNLLLTEKMNHINNVYTKWKSLSLRTDTQIRRVWHQFHFALRHKYNIIRIVRESLALSSLTNFFRYIIIPNRAKVVANYFQIRYIGKIRAMTKKATIESAERIHRFALNKVIQDNIAFACNWTSCITEAFSSVAAHQLGPPTFNKPRMTFTAKNKIKVNRNEENIPPKIQPSTKIPYKEPEYSTQIIKITRDFDPNEENSDIESHIKSDIDNYEIEYLLPITNKQHYDNDSKVDATSIKYSNTAASKSKTNQSPKTINQTISNNDNGDLMIEINPSESLSASVYSMNPSDNPSYRLPKKIIKAKQKDTHSKSSKQKPQPAKKRKQKPLEFYAPVVIPEGRKINTASKRQKKPRIHCSSHDLSRILSKIGIHSGLESLDDNEYSEINYRFDDDESTPFNSEVDYIVDLMKLNSNSGEERRIKQSLLEASEGILTDPNDKENKRRSLKHVPSNLAKSKSAKHQNKWNKEYSLSSGGNKDSFLLVNPEEEEEEEINENVISTSSSPSPPSSSRNSDQTGPNARTIPKIEIGDMPTTIVNGENNDSNSSPAMSPHDSDSPSNPPPSTKQSQIENNAQNIPKIEIGKLQKANDREEKSSSNASLTPKESESSSTPPPLAKPKPFNPGPRSVVLPENNLSTSSQSYFSSGSDKKGFNLVQGNDQTENNITNDNKEQTKPQINEIKSLESIKTFDSTSTLPSLKENDENHISIHEENQDSDIFNFDSSISEEEEMYKMVTSQEIPDSN